MKNDPHARRAFVCGVAWQHELGLTDVRVYPTAEMCKQRNKCTKDCGVVEIKISFERWVKRQEIGGDDA